VPRPFSLAGAAQLAQIVSLTTALSVELSSRLRYGYDYE